MKSHFTHKKRIVFPAILVALTLLGAWLLTMPAGAQTTNCPDISVLPCEAVKLLPDQIFEFDGTEGGIPDANGVGTGFTMVDPPSSPGNPTPTFGTPGYWPENLLISNGTLLVTSTPGLMSGSSNSQDNALGIGLDLGGPVAIETTIVNLPPAPGGFTQAGIWFGMSAIGPSGRGGTGTSEENYIKLALISPQENVWEVQGLMEIEGESVNSTTDPVLPNQPITLRLELNPSLATVQARYCNQADCDASAAPIFQAFPTVPSEWFSADAAGIDFTVGTRSMGGIFTTHRRAEAPVEFSFERFAYTTSTITALATSKDGVDFETWSFGPIAKPTAMDFGPDGRLYISDVTGFIHAVTLDYENRTLAEETIIDTVQMRLMLGLTIDPDSTPDNMILWVAHSDLDQFEGEANSGTITRLSGPGFAEREDVITGLPRAIANHATNNIHFGPDGRLYIAQGGNTGGGAANAGGSEFGPRPEQPLSAGILAADVKAPDFDGTCASEIDPDGAQMDATGIAAQDIPCDVEVYASGMRNPYDLYFRSNGEMYATDNGLGVVGTFPDLKPSYLDWDPASGCEGMVENIQDHFPGERPDLLHRVQEGAYYGHPNPARGECVFFGGNPTDQADFPIPTTSEHTGDQFYLETELYPVGMQPDPRLRLPIFNFGENKSANGIIE
ncbi:MAG TPA: hypothetical protein VLS48_07715, partial [Anaerolineales bacterium]|nr:hypothetical protein [Anaerolineales bacterium]